MIIALTGTPGTGKTSVAEELTGHGFDAVDLTRFVKKRGLGQQNDEFDVDVDAMVDELEDELNAGKDYVVEGHLAHHVPADYLVVLRCNPEELRERLEERGYDRGKLRENIEAEIVDSVLIEAISEDREKVIEVDTTGREAKDVASEILRRVENGETGYGSVDWTDLV